MIAKVRSFVSTVWFVITDTFRSRKGAVEQTDRRRFYRNATGPKGGLTGSADDIRRATERGVAPDDRRPR